MRRSTLFGLLVVLVGIFYLLTQMGALHVSTTILSGPVLWPLVLALFGLYEISKRKRRPSGTGAFFFVYGIFLALKDTRLFPWLNHIGGWSLFFGVAIVLFGLSFLMPRRFRFRMSPVIVIERDGKKKRATWEADNQARDADEMSLGRFREGREKNGREWRILGDLSIGKSPWVLRDLNLWNGIGDIRVNLVNAHVDDGTHHIDVRGWIGQVRILVPEGLAVVVDADVSVGNVVVFGESHAGTGRKVHFEDVNFAAATRSCVLQIELNIGDVEVVRVP